MGGLDRRFGAPCYSGSAAATRNCDTAPDRKIRDYYQGLRRGLKNKWTLDYRILTQLGQRPDGRFAELARELRVSQPTVAGRCSMEERGVILGSSLRLDYGKASVFRSPRWCRIVPEYRDQYRLEDIARGQPGGGDASAHR